jgi:hypothetical protein
MMDTQPQYIRCEGCGRTMRRATAERVGRAACATCRGITSARTQARTSAETDAWTRDDALAVWGTRGVYGASDAVCAHRGVCRHAPRTAFGIAYAWDHKRGAYNYTPLHQSARIPGAERTPLRMRYPIGRRAGVCERCDQPADAHTDGGACTYRPRVDAIAGDARAFAVDDVDAYVQAFRARTRITR